MTVLAAGAVFALASCSIFEADPQQTTGAITVRLPDQQTISAICEADAVAKNITSDQSGLGGAHGQMVKSFKVEARNLAQKKTISQKVEPGSTVTIDSLVPGDWDVVIFGYEYSDEHPMFYGNSRGILVNAGQTSQAAVVLNRVEPNTQFSVEMQAATESLPYTGRANVKNVYVTYKGDELEQSGSAFFEYSDADNGGAQPSDTNKLLIPMQDFLEPGYSYSATVYLFGSNYSTLWSGSVSGSMVSDGKFPVTLNYVNSETQLQHTPTQGNEPDWLKLEDGISGQMESYYSFNINFDPRSYDQLNVFKLAQDVCGKVPVIVECGSVAWAKVFTIKHSSEAAISSPSITLPIGETKTLALPDIAPEWPLFDNKAAASTTPYYNIGFAQYSSYGDKDHDTWSAATFTPQTGANAYYDGTPPNIKMKAEGPAVFNWTMTVTKSADYGYFTEDEPLAPGPSATKDFTGTLTVAGVAAAEPAGGGGGTASGPQGMTYGEFVQMPFSIAADKQVYFSPGNLWYQASTSTFKFADKQYDIVGKTANEDAFTAFISSDPTSYTGWTDLFEWGSSGAGISGIDYPPYTRKFPDGLQTALHVASMTGTNAELDWGVHNAISNGGNEPGLWRTLTWAEWSYLFHTRSGAPSKRAPARVNGIAGMILFPDTWNPESMPSGMTLNYTNATSSSDYYGANAYSALEFSQLEALGAVFLPATGCCYSVDDSSTSPSWDGYDGSDTSTSNSKYVSYWTATAYSTGSDTKYKFYTSNGGYNKADIGNRNESANTPAAVRLIQDRPDYYTVAPYLSNKIYVSSATGSASGDGSEASPLDSIDSAVTKILEIADAQDYTIYIDGQLTTTQSMNKGLLTKAYAKSITIMGKNGIDSATGEPNDGLVGSYTQYTNGNMLKIATPVPITIKNLKISGGYSSGGGIDIGGAVYGNTTKIPSDVTLGEGTLVTQNESGTSGAGVYVNVNSKLTIDGAVITKNTNKDGQGAGVYFAGKTLVIKGDSIISLNECSYTSSGYSAVYCAYDSSNNGSTITITENAQITGNKVTGVRVTGSTFELSGNAKITNNENQSTSTQFEGVGAGLVLMKGSTSVSCVATISGNAEISGNKTINSSGSGAGVYVVTSYCTLNITGGSIKNNSAYASGAGIRIREGTVNMSNGEISGNTVTGSNGKGAGVLITSTTSASAKLNMTGGIITGNTFQSSGTGRGVYVDNTVYNYDNTTSSFSMGGSAKVASDNDIYLMTGTVSASTPQPVITITSALTDSGPFGAITLQSYSLGYKVLSGSKANVENSASKFTLSDSAWKIDADGELMAN
ncbi:MAG: hypothetical protein IK015_01970 [Treponema sp.]|nr:hypothetical protein [Treponema sp.]